MRILHRISYGATRPILLKSLVFSLLSLSMTVVVLYVGDSFLIWLMWVFHGFQLGFFSCLLTTIILYPKIQKHLHAFYFVFMFAYYLILGLNRWTFTSFAVSVITLMLIDRITISEWSSRLWIHFQQS